MTPSIGLPSGVSLHPDPANFPQSGQMPSKDVDAGRVPVQELPPLPLTLDAPEHVD